MNENERNGFSGSSKNAKKRIIIVLVCVLVTLCVLFAAVFVIDYFEGAVNEENSGIQTISPDEFYPVIWDEDIYADKDYSDIVAGEFIRYDGQNNEGIVGINEENVNKKGEEVVFLVDMIYDIINGDYESYNARFSEKYYSSNAPVEKFTKQKVYDVTITYAQAENKTGNGTMYCLEYKILKNNGTFRNDILNGSKKQYIILTKDSGDIKIDSLLTVTPQFK